MVKGLGCPRDDQHSVVTDRKVTDGKVTGWKNTFKIDIK
jgi:hypothetical protein